MQNHPRPSEQLDELCDRCLRLAAELDNQRRRAAKERSALAETANDDLARQVIEGLDNLERALAHAEESDKATLMKGVALAEQSLLQALEKFGIRRFSAVGAPFDPSRLEAVQVVPSDEVPPGTVLSEVAKGYIRNDRVLRPARVVLSKGPADSRLQDRPPAGRSRT